MLDSDQILAVRPLAMYIDVCVLHMVGSGVVRSAMYHHECVQKLGKYGMSMYCITACALISKRIKLDLTISNETGGGQHW